jgi:tetratricopeptide (TPR) repeat protein
MSLSGTTLPKPKNWQDFERQTRELFACVLNDPNTQLNGRQGQAQNGVDVFGYRNKDINCLVGVQCKEKYKDEVTEAELRDEVNKAKNFTPKLSEFILITTAPRDQKIQKSARLLTEELAQTSHPILVYVWGWEDIEEHASKYEQAWKAFDQTWDPFTQRGFEELSIKIDKLTESFNRPANGMRAPSSGPTDLHLGKSDENTPRHGQITAFQRVIDDGHARDALKQLTKLRSDEWSVASRSERYRILVAIASAKLKLGEYDQAGPLLLDAYSECPEHKNARKNQATGLLLLQDHGGAAKVAREILADDRNNADAAGTLIQALIKELTCNDPLKEIPEELREAEAVLVAHVHFLRCRDNPVWIDVARTAEKKYPESHLLKLFAAEAVLDELARNDRDAFAGGILKNITTQEIDAAVATLYAEAREAIDKGYALLPSIAHNAAMALRFSGDLVKAKEILDTAIKQYPSDENLRLQRAIIAFSENDPAGALAVLPDKPQDPEAIGILAEALAATGKPDDALSLINNTDQSKLPEHVKTALLDVRVRFYIAHGERQLAIDTLAQCVAKEPENLHLRALQIHLHRAAGDDDGARLAFEEAIAVVYDHTGLQSRLMLSFEARKLGRDDAIVGLLVNRVATDRENEGLQVLIASSINSGLWVTAREILGSISTSLQGTEWFLRAYAILAINTGDPAAAEKISRYLANWPNDAQMILAQIGIWQRDGRDIDIQRLLQNLDLSALDGPPGQCVRIGAAITHYGDASRGLRYGYSVLMNHWDDPKAHLAYQGLILLNDKIGEAMPSPTVVTENTVVCLFAEGQERRYRIEKEHHAFFKDEQLNPKDDLALLLTGKKQGDNIVIPEGIGLKTIQILWIKPVYLDALHCSLDRFNERFPRANGPLRFKFDPTATDPLEDVRAITKARAETHQRILNDYQSKGLPLSFAAALLGIDPLDAWSGLPSVNIKFQVCRGTFPERREALLTIDKHGRKGCVLDAITLSVVRRLGVERAVAEVCGTIHTPQTVIDLLAFRTLEAQQNIGKQMGFMAWQNDRLAFQKYSEEMMKQVEDERVKELAWARRRTVIAPAIPKKDFSEETRKIINMLRSNVCDPAIAADGNDLLLLSEDMGYRLWSVSTFSVPATWLQPVLITARNEGHLTRAEYCEAINTLALSGHTYISLDNNCLIHQARKNDFTLTTELSRLIDVIGGPSADIYANTSVMGSFIDTLLNGCADDFKVKRIVSEIFTSAIRGRDEDQRMLIVLILMQTHRKKEFLLEHALGWLIGHSLGMSYFNDLLLMQKNKQ